MKLSEILGLEKKEFFQGADWFQIARESIARGEGDKSLKFINEAEYQFGILYNEYTALTSCDREIDREALVKVIQQKVTHSDINHIVDVVISTMPKWLRKVSEK